MLGRGIWVSRRRRRCFNGARENYCIWHGYRSSIVPDLQLSCRVGPLELTSLYQQLWFCVPSCMMVFLFVLVCWRSINSSSQAWIAENVWYPIHNINRNGFWHIGNWKIEPTDFGRESASDTRWGVQMAIFRGFSDLHPTDSSCSSTLVKRESL